MSAHPSTGPQRIRRLRRNAGVDSCPPWAVLRADIVAHRRLLRHAPGIHAFADSGCRCSARAVHRRNRVTCGSRDWALHADARNQFHEPIGERTSITGSAKFRKPHRRRHYEAALDIAGAGFRQRRSSAMNMDEDSSTGKAMARSSI